MRRRWLKRKSQEKRMWGRKSSEDETEIGGKIVASGTRNGACEQQKGKVEINRIQQIQTAKASHNCKCTLMNSL